MEKVADSVERPFGKSRISSESGQQEIIGFDHLEDRGSRASEVRQNNIERFSNQGQAVSWQRGGQLKLGKYESMALEDQRATVHQRTIKIENDQFHGNL
jgi:hypothetical protein